MRHILLCMLALLTIRSAAQTTFLTSEERAYLYHVVRKNVVIDKNIGRYMSYSGDTVLLNTGDIDYDSIEAMIVLEPTLLKIDFDGVKLAPQSILAEAASKLAMWKFTHILEDPEADSHKQEYALFMKELKTILPDAAYKSEKRRFLHKQITEMIDPYLSYLDKREMIHEIEGISLNDKLDIFKAIDAAYKSFVYRLTMRYFDMLGGKINAFSNVLLAAGEGSKTYGMMEEFDKDETGKVKKSKPKGIGLFTYQYTIDKKPSGERDIVVKSDPVVEFNSYRDAKNTSVHLSLWGFNAFFQSTVVIKSGNTSYLLYANRDTKQLSPDSSYSHGITYRQHIDEVENKIIPKLKKALYDKGGYVDSKDHWKERMAFNLEKIRLSEIELRSYQTKHNKKFRKAQEKYLRYNNAYANCKNRYKNIHKLIYEKERELEFYEDQLYYMKSNLGSNMARYELRDSIYYFDDGSTFDPFTQDFHFNSITDGFFAIRLISIGSKPLSTSVDEVQLLVNVIHKPQPFQIYLDLALTDLFNPNGFDLPVIPSDSGTIKKINALIDYIKETDQPGLTALYGGGVGKILEDGSITSDRETLELNAYPGITEQEKQENRMSPEFKNLRRTNLSVYIDGTFNIHISSYTDPVASNISDSDSLVYDLMLKRWISGGNDLLSALRSFAMLESFIGTTQKQLTERDDLDTNQIGRISERLMETKNNAVAKVKDKFITYADYKAIQSSVAKKEE